MAELTATGSGLASRAGLGAISYAESRRAFTVIAQRRERRRRRRRSMGIGTLAGKLLWFLRRPAVRRRLKLLAVGPAELAWRHSGRRWASAPLRLAVRLAENGKPVRSRLVFSLYRWAFATTVALYMTAGRLEYSFRAVRVFNLIFREDIREGRGVCCHAYFHEMYRAGLFRRICREIRSDKQLEDNLLCRYLGQAHLLLGDMRNAKIFLRQAAALDLHDYVAWQYLGRAYLAEDQACSAALAFRQAVRLDRRTVMAHMNYAGRYDISRYRPVEWELTRSGELAIFDNLGRHAEDLFLIGRFAESYRYYGKLIAYQNKLRARRALDPSLVERLADRFPDFDPALPVRILSYEWVTQFGHIALLAAYYKMTRLGRYPEANYILLAPASKTINQSYLRYWDRYFFIVRDEDLVRQLFPWQRYFGDGFMVAPDAVEGAIPWSLAAAKAQCGWADENRAPLLQVRDDDAEFGRRNLERLGVPREAWYAVLHAREGGYHLEGSKSTGRHRNAEIADYIEAIRAITDRGGWVIRMGDPSMTRLPAMPNVVDYAHSSVKSERMDVFLLATCRFAIGTTSGLTTACQSFGTEMLLVNCISNDWQLWTANTDFIPKTVWSRGRRAPLGFGETYRQPVQGMLINSEVLRRAGYEIAANTSEEIAEAVRYKLDLLDGRRERLSENDPLIARYRTALAGNPYMFGAARPVPDFLERHPELL